MLFLEIISWVFYVSRVGGGGFSDGGGASFLSGEGAPWGDIGFGEGGAVPKSCKMGGAPGTPPNTHTMGNPDTRR